MTDPIAAHLADMTPYYSDDHVTLWHGDCLDVLRSLPDASVDSVVTDPPYSLTDRREQYCAGDVLRDAIIMDAQHADAERAKSLVTLRITVAPSLAMRVRGVHLDRHVAAGEEEVDDDSAAGRHDDDVLVDEGNAVAGEERLGGSFRLWVRQGVSRCIGACRCLGQHGDGLIRVPVRLRHDALGEAERSPGIVALGGAELAAVLALDVARLTGELLPASGADALDQPFELLCPEEVGAGAGARRLASVAEAGGVGGVGDSADRALSFDLVAHRAILSWRPTVLRGFMSSLWDGTGVETDTRLWRECLRVLKPGGHCLVFGSPRTWHNLQTAIERSGFEVRDSIAWIYGSGFPKSLDVSKAIDKAAGAEREGLGLVRGAATSRTDSLGVFSPVYEATAPATPDAARWQGWGTALKPAFEPIVVARKPLASPGVNVLSVVESGLRERGVEGAIQWTNGPVSGAARLGPPTSSSSTGAPPAGGTSAAPAAASETPSDARPTDRSSATNTPHGETPTASTSAPTPSDEPANSETKSSTPTAARVPAATNESAPSSLSTTSTEAAPSTARRRGARSTTRSSDSASLTATESFAGIATGLSGSWATVRIDRLADGTCVWPDGLPRNTAGGSTVAANVLTWGTGALNIDGCRVGLDGEKPPSGSGRSILRTSMEGGVMRGTGAPIETNPAGRWPANVMLDPHAAAELDRQSGESSSRVGKPRGAAHGEGWGMTATGAEYADTGGASRFFYVAKAPTSERPRYSKSVLRLRADLTPEQVGHVRARLAEAGVRVD